MTNYRRVTIQGASYFFTVNIANRTSKLLTNNITLLRSVFQRVKTHHPFHIDAIVILPDHLHCIWTLPENDRNYAMRWSLIKSGFSRGIPCGEFCSPSRKKRGERGLW